MRYLSLIIPGMGGTPIDSGLPTGVPTGGLAAKGNNIISVLIAFIVIVAVFYCVYTIAIAGFNMMTSQGDKSKFEIGRNKITFAVVGLILIFSSFLIINLFGTFLGASLINNPSASCSGIYCASQCYPADYIKTTFTCGAECKTINGTEGLYPKACPTPYRVKGIVWNDNNNNGRIDGTDTVRVGDSISVKDVTGKGFPQSNGLTTDSIGSYRTYQIYPDGHLVSVELQGPPAGCEVNGLDPAQPSNGYITGSDLELDFGVYCPSLTPTPTPGICPSGSAEKTVTITGSVNGTAHQVVGWPYPCQDSGPNPSDNSTGTTNVPINFSHPNASYSCTYAYNNLTKYAVLSFPGLSIAQNAKIISATLISATAGSCEAGWINSGSNSAPRGTQFGAYTITPHNGTVCGTAQGIASATCDPNGQPAGQANVKSLIEGMVSGGALATATFSLSPQYQDYWCYYSQPVVLSTANFTANSPSSQLTIDYCN